MRIFVDYHHYALCRSLILLFCGRLGHEVYVPDGDFVDRFPAAAWGKLRPEQLLGVGWPDQSGWVPHGIISFEKFADLSFDVLICSRTEAQEAIKDLQKRYQPRAKLIAQAGNEGTRYSWRTFPNLLSSDDFTYRMAPRGIHKLLYSQEIGAHYGKAYEPITESSARRVGCYVNGLSGMRSVTRSYHDYATGTCPYCRQRAPKDSVKSPIEYWRTFRKSLGKHGIDCDLFGHGNDSDNGRNLDESGILRELRVHGLTFHFKYHEGFGHSICQSIAAGRLVIIPRDFFVFRTAKKYLIPEVTCFEVDDENPSEAVEVVVSLANNPEWLDETGRRCFSAAEVLFGWEHEARRVGRWMEDLR